MALIVAMLLILNFADFVSTWITIASGKGVEANPIVIMLGGPFSPTALFLKLVAIPAAIVTGAWLLTRKGKDPRLAMATVIMPAIVFGTAVANNVIVAAKKVKKNAKESKEA